MIRSILLLLILCLTACSAPTTSVNSSYRGQGELNQWVDNVLIPQVREAFTSNPMLRGRSFIIADLQGDNISPQIDYLTADIRERLRDNLRQERGVNMVWRPTQVPWDHHRGLKHVNCKNSVEADYYLGIDISESYVRGTHIVGFRVVNVEDGKILTGLPSDRVTWEGHLNERQQLALGKEMVDEHIRGLRPNPFVAGQSDLAAAYLARNLSCLLGQHGEDFVVYLENTNIQSIDGQIFDLMANYLNQFNEVRITNSRDSANVIMEKKVIPITHDLRQLWVSTSFVKDGIKIGGADTMTFFKDEKKNSSFLNP